MDRFCSREFVFCFEFSSWLVAVLLDFSFGLLISGVLLIGGVFLIGCFTSLLVLVVFEVLFSSVFLSGLEIFRFERLTAIAVGTKIMAATGIIRAYSSPPNPP